MKKRKKTQPSPAPQGESRPASGQENRDFALELEAMFRAELGEPDPQTAETAPSDPEGQTAPASSPQEGSAPARGEETREQPVPDLVHPRSAPARGEDTAELNRMIDEILRLDPPFRDPVPQAPEAEAQDPAAREPEAGSRTSADPGFWTHPEDLDGLARREQRTTDVGASDRSGKAPSFSVAFDETIQVGRAENTAAVIASAQAAVEAAARKTAAPARAVSAASALKPSAALQKPAQTAPRAAEPAASAERRSAKGPSEGKKRRGLWRRREWEELPKAKPPHLQVPEPRQTPAPAAPEPVPEETQPWADDRLYSAIDEILGRQIFDGEQPAAEELYLSEAWMPDAEEASLPEIGMPNAEDATLPETAAAVSDRHLSPAEEAVPVEEAAAEKPTAVEAPDLTPPDAQLPAQAPVEAPAAEPAAKVEKPAVKPAPAEETAVEPAAPAEERPAAKKTAGKRLRSWLTDLMQETEDDWGPEPTPAASGEAAAAPAPEAPTAGAKQPSGLSLEDFLAVAVPMEEATPAVKPSRPEESLPASKRGLWKRKRKDRSAGEAAGQPSAPLQSPVRPKRREEPSVPKTEDPAEKAAAPAPSADRRSSQEVSVPPKQSAVISTPPEDTPGLTSDPMREKKSEAAGAAAPAQKPAPAEPVPSASVRPPKRRPAPEPMPRQDFASDRRLEEEPEPPEHPAVLHPEEAYRKYIKPIGGIGSRIVVTGFFALLALFFTLYLSLHWKFLPEVFSGGLTSYLLLALLLGMVITNWGTYSGAFRELLHGRFSLDTLIAFATVFAALDTLRAAEDSRATFSVVIGALLMLSLWGKYQLGLAFITTTKVLRDQEVSTGVVEVQDITKGSRGITRTEANVDAFMEKLETRDLMSRAMAVYALVVSIVAFVLTLLISAGLKQNLFWTGALIFIGSVPLTGLLAYSRLFYLLSVRLSESKAAICGYHGAEAFGGDHAILIGDEDLFPEGSLSLNGFKVYQGNPDRIIAYATAATRRSGSALFPLFDELLETHNGRHYSVDSFRFYDSGGIGATIMGDVVLLGSLDFMRRMGIHMDGGTKVRQAVYVSVDGELAAVFAVKYNPPESIRKGLAAIAGNRHFKGILVTRNFLGTPSFLRARFGVPTGAFTYPPTKERLRLSEEKMKREGDQGAVLVNDSFAGFAQAAAGGRVLRSATVLATVLSIVGGAIGVILMGILAALRAAETATAVNLLLYVLAWLLPTLLLTGWTKHY